MGTVESHAEDPGEASSEGTTDSLEPIAEEQLAASAVGEASVVIEQGEPAEAVLVLPPAPEMIDEKSTPSNEDARSSQAASDRGAMAIERSKEESGKEEIENLPEKPSSVTRVPIEETLVPEASGSGGGEQPPIERLTPSSEDDDDRPKNSAIEEILKNAEKRPDIAAAIRGETKDKEQGPPQTEEEPVESGEVHYKEGEGPHPYMDVFLQDAVEKVTGNMHPVIRGEVIDSHTETPETALEPTPEANEAPLVSAAIESEMFITGPLGPNETGAARLDTISDRIFDIFVATGVDFEPLLHSPLWYAVDCLYDETDGFIATDAVSTPTFVRLSELLDDVLEEGTGYGADNDVIMAYEFQNIKDALNRLRYYPQGVLSTDVKDREVRSTFFRTEDGFIARTGGMFMPSPPNVIATALKDQVLPGVSIDFPDGYSEATLQETIAAYSTLEERSVVMSSLSLEVVAALGRQLWELNTRGDLLPALTDHQKQSIAHFLKTLGPIETE